MEGELKQKWSEVAWRVFRAERPKLEGCSMPAAKEAGEGEKRCGRRTQKRPALGSQGNALLRSRAMSRSPATKKGP